MKTVSTAPIILALDKLFQTLNAKFFDNALSKPVITMSEKGRRNAAGWCTREQVWKSNGQETYYEINVCPEYLNVPIEDVCELLIHEMCHLHNNLNGIQDCSRSSQYHNKNFKECAENHGLNVEKHESRGFATTSLKTGTLEYIKSLDLTAFDLYRNSKKSERKISKNSTRKYRCPNENCNTRVRATKEINVKCADCDLLLVKTF